MPCKERDKLMELVLVAMKARRKARQALLGCEGESNPKYSLGLGGHPKPASWGHLKTGQLKP